MRRIHDSTVSASHCRACFAFQGASGRTFFAISLSRPSARPALAVLGSGGIRVLLLYNTDRRQAEMRHAYLRGAQAIKRDLDTMRSRVEALVSDR